MARDKLRAALADLAKYQEPTEGVSHNLFNILGDPATTAFRHRTLAIVATSYLENVLRKAITAYLHAEIGELGQRRIFEDEQAPLRDFSSRIRMARGLGIIDDAVEKDLNFLRAIRNSFAHSVEEVTFDTKAVVDAFNALNVVGNETYKRIVAVESERPLGRPEAFAVMASIFHWRLLDHKPLWAKKTLAELIAAELLEIDEAPITPEPTASPSPSPDR
jgi:hypothetical protein